VTERTELPVVRKTKTWPIIELFGPTVQGEGALAGTTSHFVRFGGCDFRCAWCDSGHAVLPEQVRANATRMDADTITSKLVALPQAEWVTLSGGNPAMQYGVEAIIRPLANRFLFAVETQGTLWKDWLGLVDMLTVSPKPPSSQMAEKSQQSLAGFLAKARERHSSETMCLKIPIHSEPDLHYAAAVKAAHPDLPFYLSVVTEMGGLYGDFAGGHIDAIPDIIARWRWVTETVVGDPRFVGVRIFPQMHALLWGHELGH
jgi:7-carboxy-7-deazaguanine synthase